MKYLNSSLCQLLTDPIALSKSYIVCETNFSEVLLFDVVLNYYASCCNLVVLFSICFLFSTMFCFVLIRLIAFCTVDVGIVLLSIFAFDRKSLSDLYFRLLMKTILVEKIWWKSVLSCDYIL